MLWLLAETRAGVAGAELPAARRPGVLLSATSHCGVALLSAPSPCFHEIGELKGTCVLSPLKKKPNNRPKPFCHGNSAPWAQGPAFHCVTVYYGTAASCGEEGVIVSPFHLPQLLQTLLRRQNPPPLCGIPWCSCFSPEVPSKHRVSQGSALLCLGAWLLPCCSTRK